jgi:hypothetical protein
LDIKIKGTVKKWKKTDTKGNVLEVGGWYGFVRADIDPSVDIFVPSSNLGNRGDGFNLTELEMGQEIEFVVTKGDISFVASQVRLVNSVAESDANEAEIAKPTEDMDLYSSVLWSNVSSTAGQAPESDDWIERRVEYNRQVHNLRKAFAVDTAAATATYNAGVTVRAAEIAAAKKERLAIREQDRKEMQEWQIRIKREQGLERVARQEVATRNFNLRARIRLEKNRLVVAEQRGVSSTFIQGGDDVVEAMIVDQIETQVNYNQGVGRE